MQRNVLEYLERTVARCPDRTAFFDGTDSLTFRALHAHTRAIGSFLCRRGIRGQGVAVFMKRHPNAIAAFLGVICGGCYYIPLDGQMPRHRMELILKSLEYPLIICDEATRTSAAELGCETHLFSELARTPVDEAALAAVRRDQLDTDPAYIVFTSGSTGTPKGVVGCHRAVIDYIENLCPVLGFSEHTVFGNQTPLYFDACFKEIFPTLKFGASTCLIPRRLFLFPVQLVEFLDRHKINTLCWVTSALCYVSSLGTFEKIIPETVRTVAFASEVFPIRQLNLWRAALPDARFINLYGPTETTGICCYYEVDREFASGETLPIGRPFPNTAILLLDGQDRVPPTGQPGEICIRGSRLTLGYCRDSARTAASFTQNPLNPLCPERIYRTGDLGCYNDRGELLFLSRKDHQIKHMGHRIELGEIEAAAAVHPGVTGACCVYSTDSQRLTLFFTGGIPKPELSAFLKTRLPRYMLPHRLTRLDAMPLTPNGKIDRNHLLQRSNCHE